MKQLDIRDVGSKNAGTLNTYSQLGPWWALLVFVFDAGKGALAVLLPSWIGVADWAVYVTGVLVIVGHNWTVLMKFRGGKGAASLMGICLATVPVAGMLAVIPGVILLYFSKNAIAGLVLGFATLNILVLAAWILGVDWLVASPGWEQFVLCLPLTLFVAAVYGITIRDQLLRAIRQRSLRHAFYGP
ncbi:Glycerol-3-phosphate acyltransferase 4 [Geodia barretti]|uniref:Glycerol-3-phosphate acyltransferase 4 n=1 Tax=Geodia barretti TaxID=519541 RepID=A0AA35WF17_GEOBA|nr:Glycerol-3-phosphate acyltransferase 4 [Geodia barretti]